jgi:hypothetical protein
MKKMVETPYEVALKRVAEQEDRVARQRVLIKNLKEHGASTGPVERLLIVMENGLIALRTSLSACSS